MLLNPKSIDRLREVGRKDRINLRDGSFLLFFFLDGPPMISGSLIDLDNLESKIDDPNELSFVAKDVGPPLCSGYPRAAS